VFRVQGLGVLNLGVRGFGVYGSRCHIIGFRVFGLLGAGCL
jgi:hypothetical protein